MHESDLELVQNYLRNGSQKAFSALVSRHLNLVFSAALRQMRSPQLAEEVCQSVFSDLAQSAAQLKPDTILTAWLYEVTRRTAIDVVRRESRRQRREKAAFELTAMNATTDDWKEIEPFLDEAMHTLDAHDRAAVLLRYFENKSLRDVGEALGTNDDAAQKRVSRAVERLREFFSKRGITVGASGVAVVISANAVQAAPAGIAFTISSAIAGTALANITTSTAIKTIGMTTLQKSLITVTLVASVGTAVYEGRQVNNLKTRLQTIEGRAPTSTTPDIDALKRERDEAIAREASLQEENLRLKKTTAEVPKLRGELAVLRAGQQDQRNSVAGLDTNDPAFQQFLHAKEQAKKIVQYFEAMPEKYIPELNLLTDVDWLSVTKEASFDSDENIRKTLSKLRSLAKDYKRLPMHHALTKFIEENNGQLPNEMSQLKPYFTAALKGTVLEDATLDAIFARYKLLQTGNAKDIPDKAWVIVEKAPVDKDYDSRAKFGIGTSSLIGTGLHSAGDPDDPSY